jgi:hypothetical protein
MRRLLITDGTEKHLGTARYHGRRCHQRKSDPLFSSLEAKISVVYRALRDLSRSADDAEEERGVGCRVSGSQALTEG